MKPSRFELLRYLLPVPVSSLRRPLICAAYILTGLTSKHIVAREAENWVTTGKVTVGTSITKSKQEEGSVSEQETLKSLTSSAGISSTQVRPPASSRLTADVAQFRNFSSLAKAEATQVGATASHGIQQPTQSSVGTAYLTMRRWQSPQALLNFGEIESAASSGQITQYKGGLQARQTHQLDRRHSAGLALGADQIQTRANTSADSNRSGETSTSLFVSRQQDQQSTLTLTAQQNLSYIGPYQVRQSLGGRATRQMTRLTKGSIGYSRGRGAFDRSDGEPSWRGFWTADMSGEYRTQRFSLDAAAGRSVTRRPISGTVTISDQLSYFNRWALTTDDALALGASQSWERQLLAEGSEDALGSSRQISLESSHGFAAMETNTDREEESLMTRRNVWQVNFTLRFAETRYVAKTTARTAAVGITRFF